MELANAESPRKRKRERGRMREREREREAFARELLSLSAAGAEEGEKKETDRQKEKQEKEGGKTGQKRKKKTGGAVVRSHRATLRFPLFRLFAESFLPLKILSGSYNPLNPPDGRDPRGWSKGKRRRPERRRDQMKGSQGFP
nr:E3 ubiquitin-protein ligase BRE1A-like [Anolis sagrei ordinatus]